MVPAVQGFLLQREQSQRPHCSSCPGSATLTPRTPAGGVWQRAPPTSPTKCRLR